jgi:creatinine amidohydrolase
MVIEGKVQLERMSSPEAKVAARESNGVVIIPIGAIEAHGPHLPVGTDTIETYEIGYRAAQQAKVVIVPPIWYGNSMGTLDFPGTVAVSSEALKGFVRDILMSLIKHGYNKPVILSGHGGNHGILDILAEEIHMEMGILICRISAWGLATGPAPEAVPDYDGHGGSSETSVMLHLCPDDVDVDKFVDSKPELELTEYGTPYPAPSSLYRKGPVKIPLLMGEMSEHSHHGDPNLASSERGAALLDAKIKALVEFLNALKGDEIRFRTG